LESIYNDICDLIEKTKPDAMAVEELFFYHNQTTGIYVAQARGVILLAAAKYGIEPFEYTPMQVKQAVVGYGNAEKTQVMEMTRRLLNLRETPKPDDVADALAIAICHCHSASVPAARRAVLKESGRR
jgi:crossover junction endodeoxyribonuclease RuvC